MAKVWYRTTARIRVIDGEMYVEDNMILRQVYGKKTIQMGFAHPQPIICTEDRYYTLEKQMQCTNATELKAIADYAINNCKYKVISNYAKEV